MLVISCLRLTTQNNVMNTVFNYFGWSHKAWTVYNYMYVALRILYNTFKITWCFCQLRQSGKFWKLTLAPRQEPTNPERLALHPPAMMVVRTPAAKSVWFISEWRADWKAPGRSAKTKKEIAEDQTTKVLDNDRGKQTSFIEFIERQIDWSGTITCDLPD